MLNKTISIEILKHFFLLYYYRFLERPKNGRVFQMNLTQNGIFPTAYELWMENILPLYPLLEVGLIITIIKEGIVWFYLL